MLYWYIHFSSKRSTTHFGWRFVLARKSVSLVLLQATDLWWERYGSIRLVFMVHSCHGSSLVRNLIIISFVWGRIMAKGSINPVQSESNYSETTTQGPTSRPSTCADPIQAIPFLSFIQQSRWTKYSWKIRRTFPLNMPVNNVSLK
jgi:hypothetical protein